MAQTGDAGCKRGAAGGGDLSRYNACGTASISLQLGECPVAVRIQPNWEDTAYQCARF